MQIQREKNGQKLKKRKYTYLAFFIYLFVINTWADFCYLNFQVITIDIYQDRLNAPKTRIEKTIFVE